MAILVDRLTGVDKINSTRFGVGGTDLGIPYLNEAGNSTIYLFGDTFEGGVSSKGWRSPIALHSRSDPKTSSIWFDDSLGGGYAKELMKYVHVKDNRFGSEYTRIPNSGISFAENERANGSPACQYLHFHSVNSWPQGQPWRSNYSSLAYSQNGGLSFDVMAGGRKDNNRDNTDEFQMTAMLKHPDKFVYFFSVKAGRQFGGMRLRRAPWNRLWDNNAYQNWGITNNVWNWGTASTPILKGNFGEPSVMLIEGKVVLSYLDLGFGGPRIVSRIANRPDMPWSEPKTQITWQQLPSPYGGFQIPGSTLRNWNVTVSSWTENRYDVSHFRGSVI